MKVFYGCILAVFILSLVSLRVFSYSPDEVVTIRSEGGSQIEKGDVAAAKEKAIQNALRKAVKSHVAELVNLSKSESDKLLPSVEAKLDDYIVEHEVSKEGVQNDVVRVVLDVKVLPEKLVRQILDNGFLSAFRHKPRILIALQDEQNALTTALERGFLELKFHVVDSAKRGPELKIALKAGDTNTVTRIGKELGSDLVITGDVLSTSLDSKQLGRFRSWRVEAALKAIKCDGAQVLAAGNFEGVELSLSEVAGKRKAAEKLAQNVVPDFPPKIIEIWAPQVATGKIRMNPIPGGSSPPQITVNSPADGEVTAEPTIRLVGNIKDDQGMAEVKLSVNGTALALDKDAHLTPEGNALSINRLLPLKPGANLISISAFDQDENKVEKSLKVFFDSSRKEEPEKDSAPQILVYSPADNEVTDKAFIPIKCEIMTREPLSSVSISVDGSELPAKFDRAASIEAQNLYRAHRLVLLPKERNVVRITVQTISGIKSERYINVFTEEVKKLTEPQIFIYEPEDHLTTTATAIPLNSEILTDAEIAGIAVFNNGKEVVRKDKQSLPFSTLPPYKVFELKETLNLEEGENQIEISIYLEQGGSVKRSITVNRIQADKLPVTIKIESPQPDQKLSTESVWVVGEVLSSVPIQEQIDITVNGKEPSLSSKGMRRLGLKKEDKFTTPINRQVSLNPGRNEIEITVKTKTDQQFKKSISVSYVPHPGFQLGRKEDTKRKYAVIVGVGKYKDPDIETLKFAGIDAESVYQFITDPERGGFPKENVRLLMDEQATREAIMKTIGEWLPSQVGPDDMVLLFYSGHGGVEVDLTGEESDGNSKYLIPHDTNLGSLFSTAILNSMMTTMLERIKSNQMIFLIDCCYSGGSTTGQELVKSISPPNTKVETDVYADFSGSGRVVISASLPNQLSFELPQLNHGLFTYNLLEGASGAADLDQDGFITLISEIYPFVAREVSSMARSYGFQQNPTLKCQVTGDLMLSKAAK